MYECYKKTMSEELHTEPGSTRKVHYNQDDKESIVDIYVSAESLRVYENPWIEGKSPNTPGSAGAQRTVSLMSENSRRRRHVRGDSVFLGVLGLLFLIGIICLVVKMNQNKTSWEREKNQLQADFKRTTNKLSRDRDHWKRLYETEISFPPHKKRN